MFSDELAGLSPGFVRDADSNPLKLGYRLLWNGWSSSFDNGNRLVVSDSEVQVPNQRGTDLAERLQTSIGAHRIRTNRQRVNPTVEILGCSCRRGRLAQCRECISISHIA